MNHENELVQSGRPSSNTFRLARLDQVGSIPSGKRSQNTASTPNLSRGSRDNGDDHGIEF